MSENPVPNGALTIGTQADFLKALQTATFHFPRELILLATQNIGYKVAFFVYVLLLDVVLHSETPSHPFGISQQKIADYLNVSLRTIKRALGFLKKRGYLNSVCVPPGKGGYQVNQIQVLFPAPLLETLLNPAKPLGLSFIIHGRTS